MRIFRDYLIGILLYCTGSQIGTCSHTPVDNLWSTISLFVLRRYITNHIGLFSFYAAAAAAAAQHFDIYQFLVKITTYFVFIFGNASTLFLMFAVICIMVSCHLGFSSNMPMLSWVLYGNLDGMLLVHATLYFPMNHSVCTFGESHCFSFVHYPCSIIISSWRILVLGFFCSHFTIFYVFVIKYITDMISVITTQIL